MAVMQERHTEQAQMSVVPYSDEDYADSFFSLQKQADTDPKQVNSDLMQTIKDLSKKESEPEKSKKIVTEKKHGQSDISGMRSGKLTAIERTSEKRHGSYLWRCKCDCGGEILVEAYRIKKQLTRSCGCGRKKKHMAEIEGQRFGSLTAVKRTEKKRGSSYLWECRCDCGNTVYVTANSLLSGNTKSCGCIRKNNIREMHEKKGIITDHVTLVEGTCIEKLESQGLRSDNSSGYRGVHPRGSRWIASIGFKKKNYYLGIYSRLEDAVRARKEAEDRLYGEFLKWYYENHPNAKNPEGAEELSQGKCIWKRKRGAGKKSATGKSSSGRCATRSTQSSSFQQWQC